MDEKRISHRGTVQEQGRGRLFIRLFLLVLMMSLMILPCAADSTGGRQNIWAALTPLLVLVISPLLVRLFRKLGIEISQGVLEPILIKLIEIIARVEEENPQIPGSQKKALVARHARKVLSSREQKLVRSAFGNIETAVQAAFERTHVGLK